MAARAARAYRSIHQTKPGAAAPEAGAAIADTTSATAYHGIPRLLDDSATEGAIVAVARPLALALVERGIRASGEAPGPIWTPLIPSTFLPEKVATHGGQVPMRRAGPPVEVATCFVFLAGDDSSSMTGQVLHPNGGAIVDGGRGRTGARTAQIRPPSGRATRRISSGRATRRISFARPGSIG